MYVVLCFLLWDVRVSGRRREDVRNVEYYVSFLWEYEDFCGYIFLPFQVFTELCYSASFISVLGSRFVIGYDVGLIYEK